MAKTKKESMTDSVARKNRKQRDNSNLDSVYSSKAQTKNNSKSPAKAKTVSKTGTKKTSRTNSNGTKTVVKSKENIETKPNTDGIKENNTSITKLRRTNFGLLVTSCILAVLLVGVSMLYATNIRTANGYALNLEDIYQKNFYDLVDNVNNTETKLAKTLSSSDETYQTKMLEEISKNATMAQEKMNNLPYSINGLDESVAFMNQVSGYTDTLSKNMRNGQKLTSSHYKSLENIYDSVLVMKESLNKMSKDIWNGYSITKTSAKMNGDFNGFTNDMKSIKQNGVDYPTMIYDGPFSDSQINKKIKGINGGDVGEAQAKKNLLEIFGEYTDNMVNYQNDTKGNFETYNYIVKLKETDKQDFAYIQMTKKGGHLLTLSAFNDGKENGAFFENFKNTQNGQNDLYNKNRLFEGDSTENVRNETSKKHPEEQQNQESQLNNEIGQKINQKLNKSKNGKQGDQTNFQSQDNEKSGEDVKLTMENAKAIALDFAKKNNLENMKVVWSDRIGGNAFINMAPIQNKAILYPDLVKAKIDLVNGKILGWEAKSYYLNHVDRTIQKGEVSLENARAKIGKNYVIVQERLALIPLEFGGEVLCYEFQCKHGGDDYYFYINTSTGKEENILKIIQTDNGNLMI